MYKISLDIREVHLGRFDNGIESHCHIDTLLTAEVKRIISRYGKGTYRTFRHHVVYRVVAPVAIFKQVIPAVQHISQSCLHHFTVVTAFILLKFQYLFPQAFQYLTEDLFLLFLISPRVSRRIKHSASIRYNRPICSTNHAASSSLAMSAASLNFART